MRRREFIAGLAGAAVATPGVSRASPYLMRDFFGAANALHVLSTRRGPRLATLGRAVALAMAAVSASRGNATVT
jgi:hypothetical protein